MSGRGINPSLISESNWLVVFNMVGQLLIYRGPCTVVTSLYHPFLHSSMVIKYYLLVYVR